MARAILNECNRLDGVKSARSIDDFAYKIASDFVSQLEMKLETDKNPRVEFAQAIGVTPGRVSQVLNNPTLFNLKSMVAYAKAVRMKVAIVAYDDDDPKNDSGPVNAQVFTAEWDKAGRPRSLGEVLAEGCRFTLRSWRGFECNGLP